MSKPRPPKATSAPPTPLSLLAGGLVLVLLLGAAAHFSVSIYTLPVSFSPILGTCLTAVIISTVIWALPRYRGRVVLLPLVAAGIFIFFNRSLLLYGAQANWAALSSFLAERTYLMGVYTIPDPLPPLQHMEAAQAFLCALFALLALPLGWAIHRLRSFWLAFALALPWLMPAFLAEVTPDWPALMVICACWATLLLSGLAARGNPAGGARITLVALPLSLGVIWMVFTLFPYEGYTQPSWAVNLRQELLSLELFPSQEGTGPSLPDPNGEESESPHSLSLYFFSAGPRTYTGRGVFQVTASQPGPIYLRGAVYQDYTGITWTGVVPQSTDELERFSGDAPEATATITSLTSPGSTAYLPYQTSVVEHVEVSPGVPVVFPDAREEYTVAYTPLEEEPTVQSVASFDPFQQKDAYYNYLTVPEDLMGFLSDWFDQAMAELEENGDSIEANATGVYAQELNTASLIAQLLERSAQYDLRIPRTPTDADFVRYFLEESHRGYCVHFATAATLLLRLHGIPARYVSGYATTISSRTGQNATEYSVRVLDSNEHAWVEIYLNGYGWYPVEVTPGSATPEDPNRGESPSPSVEPSPTPTPAATPTPAPTPTPEIAPEAPGGGPSLKWWLVGPALIAAFVVAGGVLRCLRSRCWKRMLRNPDTNAAVLWAYRWFGQLERFGGKAGADVEALVRKARFSQHTLTSQERDLVLIHLGQEIARRRALSPLWKRWLLGLLFPVPKGRHSR